jgi:hypothetical protein
MYPDDVTAIVEKTAGAFTQIKAVVPNVLIVVVFSTTTYLQKKTKTKSTKPCQVHLRVSLVKL